MASIRTRDKILSAVGLSAWLLYILACASFSPDDSKVLFPSNDPKTGSVVVAMYDRPARATRALFVLPPARGSSDQSPVRSVWTPDGSRAVALWGEDGDVVRVMVLPLTAKEPTRLLTLTNVSDGAAVFMPPVIVGPYLFFGEEERIRRVNLETGAEQIQEVGGDGSVLLVGLRDRVYYGRGLPDEGAKTNRVEIGLVDASTLALTPLFETTEAGGYGDEAPYFAVSRDSARLAVGGGTDSELQILIFENNQLRIKLPLPTAAQQIDVGFFQWSRDGATLYCPYRKMLTDQQYQYGVLEVPVNGSAVRQLPLFSTTEKERDIGLIGLQLDISHDGKTLAVASTYLQTPAPRLKPQDLALYFIDLSTPTRRITKIPIPPLPAPAPTPATR